MLGWFRSHRAVIRSPTWRRVACEADFLREEVHPLLFHTLSPSLEPHKWQRNAAAAPAASRPQGAGTASALPRPQFPSAPPGAGEAAGRLVAGITGWQTRPGISPPAARRKPNPVFQRRWADHALTASVKLCGVTTTGHTASTSPLRCARRRKARTRDGVGGTLQAAPLF